MGARWADGQLRSNVCPVPQIPLKLGKEALLSTKRKIDPRVGLIGLSRPQEELFEDCFRQFRIRTVAASDPTGLGMEREKFEGIVLPSNGNAEAILLAVRKSPLNNRLMIFALCKNTKDVLPYAQYGINVTFTDPPDRQVVLKGIRSTYHLIVNEFRRYIRIPMVLQVSLETDTSTYTGASCEISGGGMSMVIPSARFHAGQACTATFSLPGSQTLHLEASVRWISEPENMLGVKFSQGQEGCTYVKKWVDECLGIQ